MRSEGREYFEDCSIGDRLKTSGRTITETDLVLFAAFSGDWNPLHTDAESAREGPYGQRVAHGMLSLLAGLNLMFRDGGLGNGFSPRRVLALTNLKSVRFIRPVKIGDTLHLTCELVEKLRVSDKQGTVGIRFQVVNHLHETAITGEIKLLVACRPSDSTSKEVNG